MTTPDERPGYDFLVVGSGIAGLFAALQAAQHGRVALATKAALEESNTRYAQGGIAAVMFDDDAVELHVADTLSAGAGLCDEDAVRVLCAEGPDRIRDLLRIGVAFDRDGSDLARGLEAAHSRSRVLHAGGDATGAHIEKALANALRAAPNVTIFEHHFLTDLSLASGATTSGPTAGRVRGARFLDLDGAPVTIEAAAVVLASGGAGQVYAHTTNPAVATGDGVAAALRAGAVVSDAEMVQFHPTALALGGTFLVSEAVRGEGAVLRDETGRAFMADVHPMADLAPRDIVARAIAQQMAEQDGRPVVLDATALGAEFLARRFPSIDAYCRAQGVDWARTPVPVTPAAHYWMGGVRTDLFGRTSIPGLYAVGEVANTGVHGANRLASNSLLEGLVFGARAVHAIVGPSTGERGPWPSRPEASALPDLPPPPPLPDAAPSFHDIRRLMWDDVGLVRTDASLRVAVKQLGCWQRDSSAPVSQADWERWNLVTVGRLIATGALLRTESRGGHYRNDHPRSDERWRHHLSFVTESAS